MCIPLFFSPATWRPPRPLLTLLLSTESLLPFISVRFLAAKPTRVTLPGGLKAAKGTARHRSGIWTRVGIDNEGEREPFPLLSRQRNKREEEEEEEEMEEEEEDRTGGRRRRRKRKKGGKREAVISVGRAGCIRSNIMQAHTDSLLECVRSLGSCPSPPLPRHAVPPLSSPPRAAAMRRTRRTRGSGYERTVLLVAGFSLRTCVGLRFSRAARARVLPTYVRARECIRVYIRLTLPA